MTGSATGSARRRVERRSPPRRCSTAKPSRRPSKAGPAATTPGKKVLGRKRHLVVDTLGLVWALCVTPADVQDRDGAKLALEAFRESVKFPRAVGRMSLQWEHIQNSCRTCVDNAIRAAETPTDGKIGQQPAVAIGS